MFYFTGIVLSVFLYFLLLLKKEKNAADKIFGGWLAIIALHLLFFYFDQTDIYRQYPHLLGMVFPLPLLHGVFLYFYVSAVVGENQRNFPKKLLHLIPFFLIILLAIPFYSLSGAQKLNVFESQGAGYEFFMIVKTIMILGSGIFYVSQSLRIITRRKVTLKQTAPVFDRKKFIWLESLVFGLGVIWLLVAFFEEGVIFSGAVVFIVFIGFFGINQLPVFHSKTTAEKVAGEITGIRYAKSGLKETEASRIFAQLHHLMEEETLYKNSNLSLQDLAKRLHIHPNYLSQIINERENKNFYQFINELRVKEFIRLFSQTENQVYTLLAIAYDCGFNSKSTFNKYFKLYTGKTPSEYFTRQNVD